jgi:hypothetical protein
MATEKNYTPEELRREAILILHKKLGALNTYRFLAQVSKSRDDYLKLQRRLFNGQSVDELYKVAKRHWQRSKRQK